MKVLVFLEHHGDDLTKGSLGVLAKAADLGDGQVAAVVVGGGNLKAVAAEAGRLGATKVYVAADDALDPPLPQPRVDVLDAIVRAGGHDTVLFSNSVLAADIAAGLAARLDAGLNWDLVDITERDGRLVGKRPALQDSVLVDVGWRSERRVALFRTGSFEPAVGGQGDPEVEEVAVRLEKHSVGARIVDQHFANEGGPSVEGAEVVVAGGIGLGGPENFALAEELAGALGGVVGATRAVVYAGWYPHSAQIGQTGKTVSPKLYVALGVSGAVQHKVGMQNSKVIVSINKDPGAPIFEFSDLAVVGDLHAIVPKLTELVRQRRGS
ncbi:MAG TPA: electron transfer flavoprotein subunit alpha/FixB family protein [Acidimicrobiales bacterium]|nr:electron transfer flavoprotein subunit alpha/FixB family protein [Acidimicrobiales bacterium]